MEEKYPFKSPCELIKDNRTPEQKQRAKEIFDSGLFGKKTTTGITYTKEEVDKMCDYIDFGKPYK